MTVKNLLLKVKLASNNLLLTVKMVSKTLLRKDNVIRDLFLLVSLVPSVFFLRLLVITKLWEWFITPFFGGPTMTFALAFGVALTISFLIRKVDKVDDINSVDDVENIKWVNLISTNIITPLIVLVAGWLGMMFL